MHIDPKSGGLELLALLFGALVKFLTLLSSQIDEIFSVQYKLALLKDLQVEPHSQRIEVV